MLLGAARARRFDSSYEPVYALGFDGRASALFGAYDSTRDGLELTVYTVEHKHVVEIRAHNLLGVNLDTL